ncbi:MAG: cytochrome c [Pseudomonadota bacterium]
MLLAVVALVAAAAGWVLTAPKPLSAERLAEMPAGDVARGEMVFWASGCASCHAAENAQGDAKLDLAGGHRFATDFGTFIAPNISSDATHGIGSWSLSEFANALVRGISPKGEHYYPAFPYASYIRMRDQDISDLYVYMKTLPASDRPSQPHELGFPFNVRRGLGLWKAINLKPGWVIAKAPDGVSDVPAFERGRYLVESLAHCGECHTPRDLTGGLKLAEWMAGARAPDGKGRIPNISPHETGIGSWSQSDITYSLESGFTPEFDSFGSTMADVQLNMAKLPASDREAIALYLKSIPSVTSPTK